MQFPLRISNPRPLPSVVCHGDVYARQESLAREGDSASPLLRRRRRHVRLLELHRAFLATHFHCLAAELHLDHVVVERTVAGGTGLLRHFVLLVVRIQRWACRIAVPFSRRASRDAVGFFSVLRGGGSPLRGTPTGSGRRL